MNYLKSSARTTIKIILIIFFAASAQFTMHAQSDQPDSNSAQLDTAKFVMQKSAWGAVLRSAVLPGFGQFYNESYWKIPVIWGALGYLGYQWDRNNKLYIKNRDLYTASRTPSDDSGNLTYKEIREFYRDQRDLVAVFIGLTYLLNLVDAYVDAHLFDFTVSNEKNLNQYQLSLRINF
ncbi:MAG: DUF5683 domain-containing protein [Melioribacteraceae bacterium]